MQSASSARSSCQYSPAAIKKRGVPPWPRCGPQGAARVLQGYTLLGRQVDVVETSRGCTYDCSFCSIIEMRGRNFHTYSFERLLDDIRDARDHGARTIFLVDDNITLNVRRFEALCNAIIETRLNKLDYFVQAMTSSIASHGETLAPLMRRAGFRYVLILACRCQKYGTRKRQQPRECHLESHRVAASKQNVRGRRADRRQPRRYPGIHRGQPRICPPLRRLAVRQPFPTTRGSSCVTLRRCWPIPFGAAHFVQRWGSKTIRKPSSATRQYDSGSGRTYERVPQHKQQLKIFAQ